jgi:hypothetical protein
MHDFDKPLPPIENMSVEELKAELESLRSGRSMRIATKAQTTRTSNEASQEKVFAMKVKAAPPEKRQKVADKMGITLEELDRRIALVK